MTRINYQQILDEALRTVVREALASARVNGLGENGCLHITFKTRARGVTIPDFLKMRYPDTMTIVLQWTFSNLNVSDEGFGVTLTFDGRPYYIQVPLSAMTEFKDMESEFMLSFMAPPVAGPAPPAPELPLDSPAETRDPRILSMEEFRKRKTSA
ncbi:MAG: ClpXP protease specificity-enhancing factor SspB [Rickettsiales bacterium]|nr:ClpXP protease specificity-enhancing factor SspB [Rickettsiales bacterium]